MRPEQEQRITFRVSVRPQSGIDAGIYLGGKKLAATVGDISAEGIFVKLDRGTIPALKIGSNVDVEIAFDGDDMLLHGIIRSEHAGGYGIHFPARDRLGRPNPITKFERISASLQRSSLSQRLKVLKLP
jgi:PilZ domain-containing protein